MLSKSIQEFLEQGERSGLFAGDAAQAALAQLTAEGAVTADAFAGHLIEQKVLTAYQAEQLLAGHSAECLIAGRYQLQDKLGEGGMGAVYKARDTKLDRLVALKVLPAGRLHDADAVARFQREAKALARLSHPHIIQAHDSGEDRGRHFLVMEYVDGLTLDRALRRHGALPATLAADLMYQTALGLEHAHQKGLVHRDLKPANLLVAGLSAAPPTPTSATPTVDFQETPVAQRRQPGAATVKILDLGLARFLQDQLGDAHLTQEGMGMGTPDYMAPEQFKDALHADARTDVYGLGCTLYHLLAGQVPFPGSSFKEKAQAHARREPIPLEDRCPEIPAGLTFVVAKMMAKHPAERYQSAAEVANALAPHIAGGSHSLIQLRQTGKWPASQLTMPMPARGKRMLFGIGALAAAAICLCVLVLTWPALFGLAPLDPGDPIKQDEPPIAAKPKPGKPQIVTIPNGLTVAQDGTGQYTSISVALDKVEPGQTILVLDEAIYRETLQIHRPRSQAGITLEAAKGATLSFPKGKLGLFISHVPGVTVRGFRCRQGRA